MSSTYIIRSSFKGANAGAIRNLQWFDSNKVMDGKARLDIGLRNDRLKQISQQAEITRKQL